MAIHATLFARFRRGLLLAWMALLVAGCATTRVDWASRIGNYTFDQAVLELGPPDKSAKLADGTTVAEWITRRGYTRVYAPFYGYYPWYYGPFAPGPLDSYTTPDNFLRLIFNSEGRLTDWKRFYR